ncbi:predicted protein [Sclerotinia sclerotiorum 1980 UF-70]|uniref:Uncharacterized protein n=1 Tax=Sclerotinia sclerotiorum (strain ATCC 18683 / 1980 / Ss-1) TaxID=665079 RepID=A7F2Y1_SCLS1|nr:predicted protein [Sclerotinia sclerotiorum 1980 UF-70]EDN96073.1 predicted protein [Sclerotinia sclerotiorum 1980 UF-70]
MAQHVQTIQIPKQSVQIIKLRKAQPNPGSFNSQISAYNQYIVLVSQPKGRRTTLFLLDKE